MAKGIFVTGTGTDVGKTYVTALIVKRLADAGLPVSHRKTAAYCHICIKMRCLRIWLPE